MIQQVDLVGDWGNAAGARVHMAADHSLTASGLTHAVPDYTCSPSITTGRWLFFAPHGSPNSYISSESATEGKSLTAEADLGTRLDCSLHAQVQHDDQGFNICLAIDPDQTCTAAELLRKASTRP
ncbi:hypothetical protein [Kitasatospora sp. NPDC001547]|uniref:hypothetical protein n=1 Tax=Kitasatospora sp. NPDC001547 TaxID=3364015 RepID=UPI00367648D5